MNNSLRSCCGPWYQPYILAQINTLRTFTEFVFFFYSNNHQDCISANLKVGRVSSTVISCTLVLPLDIGTTTHVYIYWLSNSGSCMFALYIYIDMDTTAHVYIYQLNGSVPSLRYDNIANSV